MSDKARTWVEVDIDALEHNIKNIREKTSKQAKIIAVVKADAYGHGAQVCAEVLLKNGADMLAVACADEAMALRQNFKTTPILLLGSSGFDDFENIILNDITASLSTFEEAYELSKYAKKLNKELKIHIKIDSGMGRLGFLADDLSVNDTVEEIKKINALDMINIEGLFTHFSCADTDYGYTKLQFDRFLSICNKISDCGINIKYRHCSNSAASVLYPQFHLDAVRPGIILYGYHPSDMTKGKIDLKPVLSVKSRITHVKMLPQNSYISYGNEYKTPCSQKIATVPIGYADGFLRGNFAKANIIHNGKFLPVVGRICMDQCMINATGVNNINVGDVVTVIGSDNGLKITADDIADNLNTISYEVLCVLSKRLPRIYIKDNTTMEKLTFVL